MSFSYKDKFLFAENASVRMLVEQYGSPLYVYSKKAMIHAYEQFELALATIPYHIHYAVKANSNLSILSVFKELGAGFDIVSGGELARVLAIGADPQDIIFSGVGKSQEDISHALSHNIGCFQVESWSELERIQSLAARAHKIAPIAFRVNPDIRIDSHPYISTGLRDTKFGIPLKEALTLYLEAARLPNIKPIGIACHIGSNINALSPFELALESLLNLLAELVHHNLPIHYINLGGGLGLNTSIQAYGEVIRAKLQESKHAELFDSIQFIIEPGRALIAQAGILVTKVEYLKTMDKKHFCVVDAGMNDFIRPALYQAYHDIIPVYQASFPMNNTYDVVGPVCESGDFLGKDRVLSVSAGEYLAILSTGAYGMSMASHYNSRPSPAEVLVYQDKHCLIRPRERYSDLFSTELPIFHALSRGL